MQLETDRLLIRPITLADADDLFAYRSDAKANKYQGWIPKTREDAVQFIAKCSPSFNKPETWFQVIIIEKEAQEIIGDIGIHFFGSENKQVELGCTLNKSFQNQGFATEALKGVVSYLFTTLKKHRIIISIDPQNISSIRLVERIGFRKEAHFIESLWINGQWVDDIIYALIEKDWEVEFK